MGILSASNTLTRFRIIDSVPQDLWPNILDKLKQFSFLDIDETSDTRSFGWVSFEDMLDTEWNTAPPNKGAYLAFSLRLDTRRVSSAVLKKHVLVAMQEEDVRNQKQGKKYTSRERRTEIREGVKIRLMAQALPIPAIFDVVWATDTGVIYLASTQNSLIDLFSTQFTKTFDLHIEALTPYTLATTHLDETELAQLDALEQTIFS